jgi:RimJ/RimL family protein N-acetyltransferase
MVLADSLTLPMATSRVRLRPPSPALLDQVYELAVTAQIPWPWRTVAETPEAFRDALWSGVLAQFGIEDVRTAQPVGLISAYAANLIHGYVYVSMTLLPQYRMRAWPLEAALVFANYVFAKYDVKHIYAESAAPYFEQFKSGAGTIFEVEARFRDRVVIHGERHDLFVFTISRDRWIAEGLPLFRRRLSSGD